MSLFFYRKTCSGRKQLKDGINICIAERRQANFESMTEIFHLIHCSFKRWTTTTWSNLRLGRTFGVLLLASGKSIQTLLTKGRLPQSFSLECKPSLRRKVYKKDHEYAPNPGWNMKLHCNHIVIDHHTRIHVQSRKATLRRHRYLVRINSCGGWLLFYAIGAQYKLGPLDDA